MRLGTKRLLSVFYLRLAGCAVVGALWGGAVGASMLRPPLLGSAVAALAGAIYAVLLMGILGGAEMFLPRTRLGQALDRAPLFSTILVKATVYSAVIILIIGNRLGLHLATVAAGLVVGVDAALALERQVRATLPLGQLVAVTFLLAMFFLLLQQLIQLVGNQTFRALALGRYHRPRTEDRFFLFVDIVGSTPLAEKLGPAAVHGFLNRVFQLASDPVDDHAGEVHQYVGDEMVVTWTMAQGRLNARPIACLFAIEEALKQARPDFERDFGAVPRLRAALHAGPVITGEVGGSRRAIVFHGDVMNTASRIENATRELQRPFLVSQDAWSRLKGKEAYRAVDLGPQQLRGRAAQVRLYAVESDPGYHNNQ
jgi:adenylate cyclase